jgi:hypothetical protein
VNAKAGWGLALFALATIGGTAYTLLSTDYNVFVDLFLLSIGTIGIALFVGYKNENTSTSANVYDVVEAIRAWKDAALMSVIRKVFGDVQIA